MRKTLFLSILAGLICPGIIPSNLSAFEIQMVEHVSDGDTFVLRDGRKVRMIGVDTPETHDENRNNQNARRNSLDKKRVRSYAETAKKFLQKTIEGQEVRLESDWQTEDKYGRVLAYVYRISDGLFVNAEILKEGYGFAYLQFPFKRSKEFEKYSNESRKNKKGLWA